MPDIQLFKQPSPASLPWPETEDGQYARRYLSPFLEKGCEVWIHNIHRTAFHILLAGQTVLPITVSDFDPANAYTCSPYNHYIAYGGYEEVHRLNNPPLEQLIRWALGPLAWYLRTSRFDQVVFINNWLLSTNLYPALDEASLKQTIEALPELYPDRPLVFRSVDPFRNPLLYNLLRQHGYKMVLSRQVWYIDPLKAARTRQLKNDIRILRHHPYQLISGEQLQEADYPRLVDLYNQLYLNKYSLYNPQFSVEFLKLAQAQNLLAFRVLKKDNQIDGLFAYFIRNGVMTIPVLGYDTTLPSQAGLYRLLTLLSIQEAARLGLLQHASAGVGPFKKLRGGLSTIEYNAVFDRHLPRRRQLPWSLLQSIARQAEPFFKKHNF
jgi:hypothetical protein